MTNVEKMIFIVIPVFNRKEFTRQCLKSLSKQTFKDYKVIVVDDGSSDGTADLIVKEFPDVILLKGDGNLWWAGASNLGVNYVLEKLSFSEGDYILTLNNDLQVSEQYLEALARNVSLYPKSVLGSVCVDIADPEKMDFCGIKWNEFTGNYYSKARDFNYSYSELKKSKKFVESDMLPGRGTLIPVTLFKEIGLYDSINFPQYAADEDFALRARRSGWNLIIPTDVYVKSYILETGIDTSKPDFSFKHLKDVFFSLRSPLNLKVRYRFAIKNSRLKILYFIIGMIRVSFSLTQTLFIHNIKRFRSVR